MKQISEDLQGGILELLLFFRETMWRYRKKIKCLKLWCGAVIAVSPDGKWNWNRLPSLSVLGISWWKCGQSPSSLNGVSQLPCPRTAAFSYATPLGRVMGLFFFSFELPWIFLTSRSHWWCIGCITALIKTEHIQYLIEKFGNVMTSALFYKHPWVHLENSDPVQPQHSVALGLWFHCKDRLLHH